MKAIETVYNGYTFRSRLEARWAVFFDALGVKYEYEPEGYDLEGVGWYLPDFYLPYSYARDNKGFFLEIKGNTEQAEEDEDKCNALAYQIDTDVILAAGQPSEYLFGKNNNDYAKQYFPDGGMDLCMNIQICNKCKHLQWHYGYMYVDGCPVDQCLGQMFTRPQTKDDRKKTKTFYGANNWKYKEPSPDDIRAEDLLFRAISKYRSARFEHDDRLVAAQVIS